MQPTAIESIAQRLLSKAADRRNFLQVRNFADIQEAETPGVPEFQAGCIRETYHGMRVRIRAKGVRVIEQPPAHPEMHEPIDFGLQFHHDVFALPADSPNGSPSQ